VGVLGSVGITFELRGSDSDLDLLNGGKRRQSSSVQGCNKGTCESSISTVMDRAQTECGRGDEQKRR